MAQTASSGGREPPNPILPLTNDFSNWFDGQANKLVKEIKAQLKKGLSPQQAVEFSLNKYGLRQSISENVLQHMVSASAIGFGVAGAKVADELAIRRSFLNEVWPKDTLSLSARTFRPQYIEQIKEDVRLGLKNQSTWNELANDLTNKGFSKGDLAGHIDRLSRASRKAAQGDVQALQEFKRALADSKRQVSRMSIGTPNRSLKAAYNEVITKAEKLGSKGLDKALDVAVKEKARYNAERLARTEIARAYGAGFHTRNLVDEDTIGMKWRLSSRHPEPDICNLHANSDFYGMGPGVTPKDKVPSYPAHPHCTCKLSVVFEGEAELSEDFDPKQGKAFLNGLSKDEQKHILGVGGYDKYKQKPSSWREIVPSWEDHGHPFKAGLKKEMFVTGALPKIADAITQKTLPDVMDEIYKMERKTHRSLADGM